MSQTTIALIRPKPPAAAWPADMRAAARAAYARRLREVRPMLSEGDDEAPAAESWEPMGDLDSRDAEEHLRRCMVRYWPKVCNGRATEAEVDQYLEQLMALADRLTDADDLRFFDAWNQAFEALAYQAAFTYAAAYRPFLLAYARALQTHLARLES